ncbi:TRAP transporter substrate-binding protein [Paenisporosarcina indica]|uniref:TRAP transporter substrate-binding protein n=1 Tax=Paenisporosarcina indica TaxID=650093 RepID=UPI00094FDBD9|nr:TRAP transporter substrate-binding protein [Paenisporosarcina indica]
MRKQLKNAFILLLVLIIAAGCSSNTADGNDVDAEGTTSVEPIVLKLGHVLPSSEIHAQAAEKFAAEVEKATDGQLKIEIFADGTLGKDKDLLEGLKVGTADIWLGGAGVLSGASDTAKIFTVPFMFDDQAHFEKIYNGEVGQEISDKILEESQYKVLSYWTRGARWLTTKTEVKTPDDLAGLKIRVPDSPVFVKSFKTLGASPTPMEFAEVFTSLQQGVIDGQENPLSLIYNSKFNEVVDFLVKTEHVREPIAVVIGGATYDKLSPDLQEALIAAANGESKSFTAEEVQKGDEQFLEDLKAGGMTVVEPDLKAFQDKLDGFVDKEFPEISDIYEKILSTK